MLVQNSVYRNTYLTDGVNKDFYFSFPILEASQVLVQTSLLTDTDTVITVDPGQYTVTGVGQATGGHISFTTAPPTGSRLALTLNMPITQLYQYAELDSFPAKSHEDALAKLTLICQQTREQISRAVTLPPTSSESPEDVVASIYASREVAAVSAIAASNKADAAEVSAQAAANSASTAAQAVTTATEDAVSAATVQANSAHDSALAAAQSAADAAAASSGLAPRMDAVELVAANAKAVTDLATVTPGAGKIPMAGGDNMLAPRWIPFLNTIELITSSKTYVSLKSRWYYIIVQAAGGAGADSGNQASGNSNSGAGAGAGGCSHGFLWLEAGQTVPAVVGAGGLYATTLGSGTAGGDGGNSSFGDISATGGRGGSGVLGGLGGIGNLSDGNPGVNGQYLSSSSDRWFPGGNGGKSFLGQGSRGPSIGYSTRTPGTAPTKGGGGSGSSAFLGNFDANAQKGSAGADGIIMLMYNA